MTESVEKIKEQFEIFLKNYEAFSSGNKLASRRARKALLEVGKLTKVIRDEILETRKAMPTGIEQKSYVKQDKKEEKENRKEQKIRHFSKLSKIFGFGNK